MALEQTEAISGFTLVRELHVRIRKLHVMCFIIKCASMGNDGNPEKGHLKQVQEVR